MMEGEREGRKKEGNVVEVKKKKGKIWELIIW